MDLEKFDKWSKQFNVMLNKLNEDQQAMKNARKSEANVLYADYQTQIAVEASLRKMANDIRALGYCYNHLRESIHMQQEQFDTFD